MTNAASRFEVVDEADSPDLAAVYASMKASWPFIPNWFTAMSARPDLVAATAAVSDAITGRGQLPPSLKQLVIVAISVLHKCDYCSAAHRMMARSSGVEESVIDEVMFGVNRAKLPPTQRVIVDFALQSSMRPQSIAESDFDALREVGLDDGEIAELVLLVGFARLLNMWSDVAGLEIDDLFRA